MEGVSVGVLMAVGWGIATSVLFTRVFRIRYLAWRRYHDRRSVRELSVGTGLFLLGIASLLSILAVVFGIGRPASLLFAAVAWGAILGVAVLLNVWTPDDDRD